MIEFVLYPLVVLFLLLAISLLLMLFEAVAVGLLM